MDYAVAFVIAFLILGAIVTAIVARPVLSRDEPDAGLDERRADLEAAKEAKYREIRDVELDYRMGKVDEADYRATDRELRAQAIEILRELDEISS